LSAPVAGVLFYFLLKWAREDDKFGEDRNYEEEEFVSSADLVSTSYPGTFLLGSKDPGYEVDLVSEYHSLMFGLL
jgi:hypothetical protein